MNPDEASTLQFRLPLDATRPSDSDTPYACAFVLAGAGEVTLEFIRDGVPDARHQLTTVELDRLLAILNHADYERQQQEEKDEDDF